MDTLSNRLKFAMDKIEISQSELVRRTGINKGALSGYLNDRYQPKQKAIYQLAKALNVNEAWLMGYDVPMERDISIDEDMYKSANIDFMRIPLYPPICCGDGGFVDENIIEYIPVPSKGLGDPNNYYCQLAQGDSMKDAGIDEGDLLVFEKTSQVYTGMIGAFCIDENEATCKKYTESNGMIILKPMNSNYDPIPVDPLNEHFRCVGKLKKSIKNFE